VLLAILGIVAGLAVLTVAADAFVLGAVRLAARLRLSTVVIGAVIIGFGTSAPEIVVSGLAAGRGQVDIAVGNIIGSNVANLSLVVGIAALVTPIRVRGTIIRREAPIALAATLIFALLVQGQMSPPEGAILLAGLIAVLVWVVRTSRQGDPEMATEVEEFLSDGQLRMSREVTRAVLGLLGTLAAAQVLVVSATTIAGELGLAEGFIGFTVVAVGTSLPELATSIQAARRNETDLILGNLLGSNLFNSLGVGAVVALVGPGPASDTSLTGIGVLLMLAVTVLAVVAMITGRELKRHEGAMLLLAWLVMLPLLA
jgi:cation:H+ antiporter